MTFKELIEILFEELNNDLPGEKAHELMSPSNRPPAKAIAESNIKPKLSATLLLLYPKNNEIHFALIQRPDYKGTHGGQISFPGGKQEGSETLKETALRETHEEIGVLPEKIQILGELTSVYIPPSNFLVSPFLGFLDDTPSFIPDEIEVDDIIEIKVLDLLNEELIKKKKIQVGEYTEQPFFIEVPYFELNYNTVWGATAIMLSEFRQILINGLKKS